MITKNQKNKNNQKLYNEKVHEMEVSPLQNKY